MTNTPQSDRNSSPSTKLGFDEFIAIFVAFSTIGAILWWSLSQPNENWQLNQSPSTTVTPSVSPPLSTDVKASLFPLPTVTTTPTPIPGGESESEGNAGGIMGSFPSVVNTPPGNIITDNTSPPVSTSPQVEPSPIVPVPIPKSPQTPETTVKTPSVTSETPANKKSTIPPPIAFTDIPPNFWGNRFIDTLSKRRIIEGFSDYTFRPNQPVNRAQFAAMLQKAIDKQTPQTALNFKDVPDDFWGKGAIQKGIGTGFLKGYPNQNFKPDQKIPRVQVLVALASGLNLPIPKNPESVISIYKDAKDIPKYAVGKVAAATVNQLVVNYPDTKVLAPNKEATRAEVAAIIHQTLVRMKKLDAIQSPYIVRPKN